MFHQSSPTERNSAVATAENQNLFSPHEIFVAFSSMQHAAMAWIFLVGRFFAMTASSGTTNLFTGTDG